ncbi:MAG: 50S ribosomal protein L35 [Christensenellales bacterium]|nr:50S ribosomal protein L35 [Bacillota bacterium]MDY3658621.1 50S ribosomal protein L35 [Eubacteriales bacterium]
MPKMKSHSGAKKRFKISKSGNVKYAKPNRGHFLTEKSQDRKRGLRKAGFLKGKHAKTIKRMVQG